MTQALATIPADVRYTLQSHLPPWRLFSVSSTTAPDWLLASLTAKQLFILLVFAVTPEWSQLF
jgi:hypothetical protein